MPTYFGLCDSAGNPTGAASLTNTYGGSIWNHSGTQNFTCPGSGNQIIKSLGIMVHTDSNSPTVRIAVYSANGSTLIAQGTASFTVTGSSDTWQGHAAQANITPNPATLVGGTNYILVWSFDALPCTVATDHGVTGLASGATDYDTTDHTGGYSGALSAVGNVTYMWPVRCGVDPEGNPQTATLIVIVASVATPTVTGTYQSVLSGGTVTIVGLASQPSVTATYQAVYDAGTAVATAAIAQPVVTATYLSQLTASLAALVASVAQPEIAAVYEAMLSAGTAAIVALPFQPEVTATCEVVVVGETVVIVAGNSMPPVAATCQSVLTAEIAVIVAAIELPGVTAQTLMGHVAELSAIVASVSQPAVTASYEAVLTAALLPIVASVSQSIVTALSTGGGNLLVQFQQDMMLSA